MIRRFLPALLALAACATSDDPLADGTLVYEDDPNAAEAARADGTELGRLHRVEGYETVYENRIVSEPMAASSFDVSYDVTPGTRLRVIRRFDLDGTPAGLFVDVDTGVFAYAESSVLEERTREALDAEISTAPYFEALRAHRNAAIDRLPTSSLVAGETRFVLTVDMCPSSRAWDVDFFEWLVALSDVRGEPIPVGIAMTGYWAERHGTWFARLAAWQADGKLDITWIDHSYTHARNADGTGQDLRFLTAPGTDIAAEAERFEALMLSTGQMASPFFRFPGLTHDVATRGAVNDLNLFALDGNAWIAKGQPPRDGAVILVHANGNERVGIDGFFRDIRPFEAALRAGTARFVPPLDVLGLAR